MIDLRLLRPTLLGVAVALTFSTVQARDLEPVDALADAARSAASRAPRAASRAQDAGAPRRAPAAKAQIEAGLAQALGVPVKASLQEGLGVPSFVRVARSGKAAPGRAGLRGQAPERAARGYLRQLARHYAMTEDDAEQAKARVLQRTAAGGSLVRFQQEIGGVGVFRDEMTLLMDADNELLAVSGQIGGTGKVAGSFDLLVATVLGQALEAHGFDAAAASAALAGSPAEGGYTTFRAEAPLSAADGTRFAWARSKPVYFRLPEHLVPAYYLETEVVGEHGSDAHAWVISAVDGSVLFRTSLIAHSHSYRLWAEGDGEHLPLPGPQGRQTVPFPSGAPLSYRPDAIAPTLVTPMTGDLWLDPEAEETVGNNVDAYADLDLIDGFSAGDLRATVTATGVFDRTYDLSLAPGASADQIMASVTSLFYVTNFLHDWFYEAGFDEAAGNAQHDNYGRGGVGGDRLRAEAQDASDRNNANMFTPADGVSPRMQMFLWDGVNTTSITAGVPLNEEFPAGVATFGPTVFDVTANIVKADPFDGCGPILNDVAGAIAVMDRGYACAFPAKVYAAESAGAVGVLVVNNEPGDIPPNMGGSSPEVTIPSMLVSNTTGAVLDANPGISVRMRRAPIIDVDSTLDSTIVAHEWGHYLSNRLVGNGTGISTIQAQGMGEGWSDFVALLMTVKAEDAAKPGNDQFQGAYGLAAHAAQGVNPYAFYRGVRRYPYSTDLAINPLHFGHISNETPLPASPPPGNGGGSNYQVHNTGEVWASMLWECYAGLLRDTLDPSPRIASFDEAQRRMKRYLVTGLKLTPMNPTFTEARDALLVAMAAENEDDAARCAEGFAKRGAGVLAVAPDRYNTQNIGVVADFASEGGDVVLQQMRLDDSVASVDGDGHLDAGERGLLHIRYANAYLTRLDGLSLTVSSTHPDLVVEGPTPIGLPTLEPYDEVEVSVPVRLAAGLAGIQEIPLVATIDGADLAAGARTLEARFRGNLDEYPLRSRVDGAEDEVSPWSGESTLVSVSWSRIEDGGSVLHRVFHGPDASSAGLVALVSPELHVSATRPLRISFRHRFSFEASVSVPNIGFDGGVAEISDDGGTTWTALDPSIYNGSIIFANYDNPYRGQPAFVGQSAGYPAFVPVAVDLGTAYAGKTVRIRFAIASDYVYGDYGWDVDDIYVGGTENLPFTCVTGQGLTCGGLVAVAGDGQSTMATTPFAAPLEVQLTGIDGQPLAGVEVSFAVQTGPAGSGATFPGDSASAVVTSDAQGRAVAPPLTANGVVGNFGVQASALETESFVGGAHLFELATTSLPIVGDPGVSARIVEGSGCSFAPGAQFLPLEGAPGSPPAGSAPPGVVFPYGLFDFSLQGCVDGWGRIELEYPDVLPDGATYWKYGRTMDNPELHWYQLTAADNQLEIVGNRVSFTLTDGGWGDDDITVDGVVVDQGGVGVPAAAAPDGVTAVPLLAPWALAALAAGLGLAGGGAIRRRRN